MTYNEERRYPRGSWLNVDGVKRKTKPSLCHILFRRRLRLFIKCLLFSYVARAIFSHTYRESSGGCNVRITFGWDDKQKKKDQNCVDPSTVLWRVYNVLF